jgi:hypothetical protein
MDAFRNIFESPNNGKPKAVTEGVILLAAPTTASKGKFLQNSSSRAVVFVANKDTNMLTLTLVLRTYTRNQGTRPIKRHSLPLTLQKYLPSPAPTAIKLDLQRYSVLRRRMRKENQKKKFLLCLLSLNMRSLPKLQVILSPVTLSLMTQELPSHTWFSKRYVQFETLCHLKHGG